MRKAAVRAAGADEQVTLTHPASQYRLGPGLFIYKSSISLETVVLGKKVRKRRRNIV